MPFKRPASPTHVDTNASHSGSESASSAPPLSKRARLSTPIKPLSGVKIYIVQAKLEVAAISELYSLAERYADGVCNEAQDADVIVTAITMRRRLERHISWELAKSKAIVSTDWLRDSVGNGGPLPCGEYAAIRDLEAETVAHCPDCNLAPCACSDWSEQQTSSPLATPSQLRQGLFDFTDYSSAVSFSQTGQLPISTSSQATPHTPQDVPRRGPSNPKTKVKAPANTPLEIPEHLLPPSPPIPTDLKKLNYASRYSCQRASPLECPNQGLVCELDIVRRSRAMEGEERSALSYARAIAAIKAYPYKITSSSQVHKLPFIGAKVGTMVEEYIERGEISEAQTILASPRFQSLSLFTSIYGIGPNTARRLCTLGLRSLQDLEVYYGVERGGRQDLSAAPGIVEVEMEQPHQWSGKRGKEQKAHDRGRMDAWGEKGEDDEELGESWIRIALELREDLTLKIPKDEVEEMGRVVMGELNGLEPGCVGTIVGGYRRGKLESNDVDIVFTHPDGARIKGLCKRFVRRLYECGMVSHVMYLSGFHTHNPLRTTHWDSLEKALTVFTLPASSPLSRGVRRRLDLIFAQPEVYWTAVIGWTGSIMFQRDLRQWAKDKHAMKFDSSGITRRYDSKEFFPKTEKEAFDLLGLEWVDPTWRNTDA